MCLGVIGSALAAAWFVWTLYDSLAEVPRIQISGEVLRTETPPGLPVNFLLVGTDSARGLDPDDPILIDRVLDPEGRSLADTIMLLRLDPNSGSAWVLSLPRDLIVDIPGAQTHRINAALFVGGPNTLVETVSDNLDVVINHYVQLDFLGFREVVDVLGGVPVWFSNPAGTWDPTWRSSPPAVTYSTGRRRWLTSGAVSTRSWWTESGSRPEATISVGSSVNRTSWCSPSTGRSTVVPAARPP